ncbi:MAG: flavin reductase family protein [Spirochaetaceae bacterium]|jgi:flavin reductase (DIM6/NTAB) family NADH-FMN oxidoreductase RutF|nr:flavin reductase family protein [Spirochaetaceae bacterium]
MKAFPLNKAFTFLEPGPVILVSTADGDRRNIMTLSWTMVLDFTPRFAFMTGSWNYSYKALVKNKECVIAVPTADMIKTVVSIGACSGADVDKFEKFKLTPLKAEFVGAPLIKECYANIECRVVDYIKKHGIFILDAEAAWIDERRKEKRLFHAVGDGKFIVDGEKISHRKLMLEKLPEGV